MPQTVDQSIIADLNEIHSQISDIDERVALVKIRLEALTERIDRGRQ